MSELEKQKGQYWRHLDTEYTSNVDRVHPIVQSGRGRHRKTILLGDFFGSHEEDVVTGMLHSLQTHRVNSGTILQYVVVLVACTV